MRNFTMIGLTGPTGAGKSTASQYLKQAGCSILDGDLLARQALAKGSTCVFQLGVVFGEDIINAKGEVIRGLLAERAFSSPENTKKLNDITHPWIFLKTMEHIDRLRTEKKNPTIVLDAAAMLESKMDILCDYTVSVIAEKEIRIRRILKRDNITMEQAITRVAAQKSDDYYIQRSDYVIDGNKEIEEIYHQTEQMLKEILKRKGGDCN